MATKKTPAKTKKTKTRYYAAVVPSMVNVDDGSAMTEPMALTDAESISHAEANPNFVEITKGQFDKLEDYVREQVYAPLMREFSDLQPNKRNAGDWVFAILLLGGGALLGGLLF